MTKQKEDYLFTMGDGHPVVLLHSSMSSKLQWYRLMTDMQSSYHLIAVDLYCSGGAPMPENNDTHSLSDEVSWVETAISRMIPSNEPFHLVGHSYGGAVGLRAAYKLGSRILSLSLFEPVAFHLLPENEEARYSILDESKVVERFLEKGEFDNAARYFIDLWSGSGTYDSYPMELKTMFSESIKIFPINNRALHLDPLSLKDYRDIEIPINLMCGRRTRSEAQRICELLAENLPNCSLKWLDGGHMMPVTHPQEVNPLIHAFIDGNSR